MKRRGWIAHVLGRVLPAMVIGVCPALAAAQCSALGAAASRPVYGSISMSVGGTVSNGITTSKITGNGTALNQDTGAKFTPASPPTLPPLSPATFPANSSSTDSSAANLSPGTYRTITPNSTTSFAPGTYYINALNLSGGDSVNFGAGTYYIGTLTLANSGSVNVTSGTVRLNIGTLLDLNDNNNLNTGGAPSALQVFFYPGADATIHDKNKITGLLYAPDSGSVLTLHKDTTLIGAVIGTNVDLGGSNDITYTPSVQSSLSAISTCTTGSIDHYELSLATTGLACMSTTATVTACADSSNPCTSASTSLNGQTASLSTSAGSLGSSTVTFNASGVASTTLSYPAASNGATASVTLSGEQTSASSSRKCCPDGSSCSSANSCQITFSTAGFIVSASANGAAATISPQTAGTASGTYYLRAVKTGTGSQACEAALTGTTTVGVAHQCNNPTTCSSSNLMRVNATAVARNANTVVSSYTPVSMTFDANGSAPFTFSYADVGQVTLWVSKVVNGATLSAASNAFVTRPAGLAVTGLRQTALPQVNNPAAATAAGAKFVRAGESFSATVTALTSDGAAASNFGRETNAEGVLLTRSLVLPVGGSAGTLSNAIIGGGSFVDGVATVTNLAWNEVGIITLTPSIADGSYLGTGDVAGTTSANIGRFVPDRFALSATSVLNRSSASPACSPASSFTHLDENFRLGFTLSAQGTTGTTTTNYAGAFAKFDLSVASAWNLRGIAASTVFATTTSRLALGAATGSWSGGVASGITLTAAALRSAAPDGPHLIDLGIAPVDTDGVAMQTLDLATAPPAASDRARIGTVVARFGRLRLSNALGSEKTSLQVPVQTQYWSGSAWVTNSADNCTSVPSAAVVRSGYLDPHGVATTAWSTSASGIGISGGRGVLTLSAPTPAATGSLDVALNLGVAATDQSCLSAHPASTGAALPWLRAQQGSCSSAWDRDPAARASFGIYAPETRKTVHVREIY